MKIDMFNINKFIELNECPQITNPSGFNYDGTPTTDGLFSYELFGMSDSKRKTTFGYVDLNKPFIHPAIFTVMNTRMGNIKKILSGDKFAKVDKLGNIVYVEEDDKSAETGVTFFYNNFDKIKWNARLIEKEEELGEESESLDKNTRLKLLRSIKKDEMFVDKWLILPPFYRDTDAENQSMGEPINKLYKELIARSRAIKSSGGSFDLFGASTEYRIQTLLYDIYQMMTLPVRGKRSLLRQNLLGKSIDYSAANVITAPSYSKANKPEDLEIKFGEGGFPLATVLSLFQPFVISSVVDFMQRIIESAIDYKNVKSIDTKQYSVEKVEKLIKLFIKSPGERFSPLTFEYINQDGEKIEDAVMLIYESTKKDLSDEVARALTLTDIMYMAALDASKDKHSYVTRHPVTNYLNIYPSKIKLMSTAKTREVWLRFDPNTPKEMVEYFKEYPMIPRKGEKMSSLYDFVDVMIPSNIYMQALNGDYDGDMLYLKSLFSKEANEEADRLINSKTNFLGGSGQPMRSISGMSKEVVMALYRFTKEVD
jgi:DNA-directed RNA polymerase beta' subunit